MNFKVGDRVRIKTWNEMEKEFGTCSNGDIKCCCIFTKGMKYLCGKKCTITDIDGELVDLKFDDDIERKGWDYSTDMIKPFNECIVVYRKNDDVIAIDKKTGKKAKAACSKDDVFDFHIGAKLAFDRLMNEKGYVEVRRIAKANEYVKIVNAGADGATIPKTNGKPDYQNGDILEIIDREEGYSRGKDGHGTIRKLNAAEYVVLEGYEPTELEEGDTVHIVNQGEQYTTNVNFFKNNGLNELLERYAYARILDNWECCKVIRIIRNFVVLEHTEKFNEKAIYLFDVNGVSKVVKDK